MHRSTAIAICFLVLLGVVLLVANAALGVVFFIGWAVIGFRGRAARKLRHEAYRAEHRRIYGF